MKGRRMTAKDFGRDPEQGPVGDAGLLPKGEFPLGIFVVWATAADGVLAPFVATNGEGKYVLLFDSAEDAIAVAKPRKLRNGVVREYSADQIGGLQELARSNGLMLAKCKGGRVLPFEVREVPR